MEVPYSSRLVLVFLSLHDLPTAVVVAKVAEKIVTGKKMIKTIKIETEADINDWNLVCYATTASDENVSLSCVEFKRILELAVNGDKGSQLRMIQVLDASFNRGSSTFRNIVAKSLDYFETLQVVTSGISEEVSAIHTLLNPNHHGGAPRCRVTELAIARLEFLAFDCEESNSSNSSNSSVHKDDRLRIKLTILRELFYRYTSNSPSWLKKDHETHERVIKVGTMMVDNGYATKADYASLGTFYKKVATIADEKRLAFKWLNSGVTGDRSSMDQISELLRDRSVFPEREVMNYHLAASNNNSNSNNGEPQHNLLGWYYILEWHSASLLGLAHSTKDPLLLDELVENLYFEPAPVPSSGSGEVEKTDLTKTTAIPLTILKAKPLVSLNNLLHDHQWDSDNGLLPKTLLWAGIDYLTLVVVSTGSSTTVKHLINIHKELCDITFLLFTGVDPNVYACTDEHIATNSSGTRYQFVFSVPLLQLVSSYLPHTHRGQYLDKNLLGCHFLNLKSLKELTCSNTS